MEWVKVTAMSPVDLAPVARLVVDDHRAAPAAVVAASITRKTKRVRGLGAAGSVPGGLTPETPFDLASVTKPFVALTLARLESAGVLGRDERLGDVVPALADTPASATPLDWIAAHRAGLSAHERLFAPLEEGGSVDVPASYLRAASSMRVDCAGQSGPFPPVYSDMGYLLLGLAIEARTGEALDGVVRREVLEPLGLTRTVGSSRQWQALDRTFSDRVAATEHIAFRGGVVRGLVHDENAFALVNDGLAGHAGLFGDAASVLTFGEAVLDAIVGRDTTWITARALEPVLRDRPGGTLLAGFDRRSPESPSSGSRVSAATFGHLGFTGTSLWIDPERGFVGVLLTNRVHPTREHIAIRAARPAAYDAMFDLVSA